MDLFHAMRVFNKVVETNSFSLAADSLGLPRASVTTTIQALEKHLQTRLLNRTTRKISLTPEGSVYYDRSVQILADIEDVESNFHDPERGPRGRFRIDVKASIGRRIIIPNLSDFYAKYPDIDLVIGMNDRPVDLVQDAVDCVIRVGQLQDSNLVARRIGTIHFVTVASPEYLSKNGEPKTIQDLKDHQVVNYFDSRTGRNVDWNFVVNGETKNVGVNGVISVNDGSSYIDLALQGFGLIQCPYYMVAEHLEKGALKQVLSEWLPVPLPISLVYLQNRHLSPKVRVFVDWVVALFQKCPLLNGCSFQLNQDYVFSSGPENDKAFNIKTLVDRNNATEAVS